MESQCPNLVRFLEEGRDFHREWAAKIYQVPLEGVTKDQRDTAKNSFVFPRFYGALDRSIAGYLSLDEDFIASLGDEFWGVFFGVKAWQDKILEDYERLGYIRSAFGFRRYRPLDRNKIINFPIQATAAHLLLYALREVESRMVTGVTGGLLSRIIAEVHDSLLIDLVASEAPVVWSIVREEVEKVRFPWQHGMSMPVEGKVGLNWLEMSTL